MIPRTDLVYGNIFQRQRIGILWPPRIQFTSKFEFLIKSHASANCRMNFSIISDIVDGALSEEQFEFYDEDVGSVFRSILCDKDLDVRDKKSAIIDFIAAGIETLAHTLIFVLNYVTANDKANDSPQKKIFKEFEHCVDVIDSTDLSQAVYTKACLQETYRICPTAFCLARILEQDTTLSGYQLKAGVSNLIV